jgi:hypothetical protein
MLVIRGWEMALTDGLNCVIKQVPLISHL